MTLANYSFPIAKFKFIAFESCNKICLKMEKTWFLLVVHFKKISKQLSKGVLKKISEFAGKTTELKKISEFAGKTTELQSLLNIVSDLRCFHVNFYMKTPLLQNIREQIFWKSCSFRFHYTITDTICWEHLLGYHRLILLHYFH